MVASIKQKLLVPTGVYQKPRVTMSFDKKCWSCLGQTKTLDYSGVLTENDGCAADMAKPRITLGFWQNMLVVPRTWQNPGLPWVFGRKCWLCPGHGKTQDYPGFLTENVGCAADMPKPWITLEF